MSDLHRAAASMFCVGLPSTQLTPHLRSLVERGVGGIIYFKRNIESAGQIRELSHSIKRAAGRRILTSVDQEGGRVARLSEGFTAAPEARIVGKTKSVQFARNVGRVLARELRAVGIDVNFAPVLDVDTNPANPVIGERSFGPDPQLVARLGCAVIAAIQAEGVAACAKHFPGHGDTSQDSHHHLPRLDHGIDRLNAVELVPFAAAVRAGVASIMTAHVVFTPLDPVYPATLSAHVIEPILRTSMGFNGVVISDDLEMRAIADHYELEEVIIRGANAGVDLFLVCHHEEVQSKAIEHLTHAADKGHIKPERILRAARRVEAMAERFAHSPEQALPLSILGSEEHRRLVEFSA